MPLKLLPELIFPVTRAQANPLIESMTQLNFVYAGIDERTQKALGILLKTIELFVDTKGVRDYLGAAGQRLLFQDSESLVGEGTGISTRIGDLRAAGLAIDFHNAALKWNARPETIKKSLSSFISTDLPVDVHRLRELCSTLAQLPPRKLDEIGLMLSYLRKDTSYVDTATRGGEEDF